MSIDQIKMIADDLNQALPVGVSAVAEADLGRVTVKMTGQAEDQSWIGQLNPVSGDWIIRTHDGPESKSTREEAIELMVQHSKRALKDQDLAEGSVKFEWKPLS